MSNLTWFRSRKAFYGMFVVWSVSANNAFQLRFSGLRFGPFWPKVLSPLTRFRLGSAFCSSDWWPFWANNAFQLRFLRLLVDHGFRNTAFKLWLSRLLLDYVFPNTAIQLNFLRQLLELIFLILPLSSTCHCYFWVNLNQIHVHIYLDLGRAMRFSR